MSLLWGDLLHHNIWMLAQTIVAHNTVIVILGHGRIIITHPTCISSSFWLICWLFRKVGCWKWRAVNMCVAVGTMTIFPFVDKWTRMSLGKYWKMESLKIFTMCDKWEQEYMCWARLTCWVWSFRLLYYIWKGKQDCSHIYASAMLMGVDPLDEQITITIFWNNWYHSFVYNCIKVFNRLASERYFLTLEIQLIWYQHLRRNSHSTLPVEDQVDE
jgi:hypothetical protein